MEQIVEQSVVSKEDKILAKLLCDGDLDTRASFLKIHNKRLLFIASKICGESFLKTIPQSLHGEDDEKSYDEIMNTYQWLIHQLQIKSCLFKAISKFENYIFTVLNSSWTKKDWLKMKTGVTGYVPEGIKKMGEPHIDVFKLMRQKKDDGTIEQKLKINPIDLMDVKNDICRILIQRNQLDLIQDYKISSFTVSKDGEKVSYEPADKGMSVENQDLYRIEKKKINDIIESFDPSQQHLAKAYWGYGWSADKVYKELKKDAPGILEKSNIKSVEDVYTFVTNFINDLHKEIMQNQITQKVKKDDLITKKGARTIIKSYFLIKK